MRISAIIPVAFCTTSFVLAFLCLFAGDRGGLLEDYAVFAIDTSRIGHNILDTSDSDGAGSFLGSIFHHAESSVQSSISSFAGELGLHDWYSAHLMTYCEGFYSRSGRHVTACSDRNAMYDFDLQRILQDELDASGRGIHLNDLNWSEGIQDGIDAVRIAARAAFVLYCIAIGFIGLALISAVVSFFLSGRLSALANIVLDWLAFVVMGIASALATAVAVRASNAINKYGEDIGVTAKRGRNFLIITWIATSLLLLSFVYWSFAFVFGRRRQRRGTERKAG